MEETIDRRASGTVDLSGNLCSAMDLTGRVHQLPCCIKYNGSSEVSNYFRPKPTEVVFDGLSVEEAQFRGRKLQGTTLPIPQGYSEKVLRHEELQGAPTFDFGKQAGNFLEKDLAKAVSLEELDRYLDLNKLDERVYTYQAVSAYEGTGIKESVNWLVNAMERSKRTERPY